MVILTEHATLLKNGDKISLYPTFPNLLIIIMKIYNKGNDDDDDDNDDNINIFNQGKTIS